MNEHNEKIKWHALEHFKYDTSTGILSYKKLPKNFKRKKIGDQAGSICHGYRRVEIFHKTYAVTRIIWLMHFGEMPKYVIDHKNGDTLDNRIANLADVPNEINVMNTKRFRDKKDHHPGVYQKGGSWVCYIHVRSKKKHLGCFKTKQEALIKHLNEKKKILGDKKCSHLKDLLDRRQDMKEFSHTKDQI